VALITRFINTAAAAGGDGTTNNTSGATRAYSTLDEAQVAEAVNLTTAGDTIEFVCTGTADTSRPIFSTGWVTSATDNITIKPNSSDAITTGIFDTAKYHLSSTVSYQHPIRITGTARHVDIDGIQSQVTSGGGICASLAPNTGATITLQNCILKGNNSSSGQEGGNFGANTSTFNIINNVVYELLGNGLRNQTYMSSGKLVIYNNTVDNCGTGLNVSSGTGSGSRAYNNLLTNNTTDYSVHASLSDTDNNVTSDATGPDTGHTSKTITYTDAANDDYSTNDADIVGLGTDLTSDSDFPFSTDIIAEARGTSWDIGAFQEPAAGGGGIGILRRRIEGI